MFNNVCNVLIDQKQNDTFVSLKPHANQLFTEITLKNTQEMYEMRLFTAILRLTDY